MKRALLACLLAVSAACSVHASGATAEGDKSRAARIRTELAVGYLEQGQLGVAQHELQQALLADPQYAQAHHAMALLHMRLGDLTRARESFERALSLAPRDPDILHNHGWLLCQQGERARAVQAFSQSLADPLYAQRARTLMAQGVCQLHAGDAEAAQASLSRSLALDPTHPLTRYHLAQALLRRGDLDGARAQTQTLNDSVFANAQTLWLGIRVERRARNAEAAARLAQRLEREHPHSQEFAAWQRGAGDE